MSLLFISLAVLLPSTHGSLRSARNARGINVCEPLAIRVNLSPDDSLGTLNLRLRTSLSHSYLLLSGISDAVGGRSSSLRWMAIRLSDPSDDCLPGGEEM